jgi:hypothetical protein
MVLYFFIAARPVPPETVFIPLQLSSLEASYAPVAQEPGQQSALIPFNQDKHVGYISRDGVIIANQVQRGSVSLSSEYWSDYEAMPETIEIRDPYDNLVLTIKDVQGYPFFLDNRLFIIGPERQILEEINAEGSRLWTYTFAAPISTLDAAADLIVAGALDGTVEILSNQGKSLFTFIPGGSRLSVITGCALSKDGTKLALISGVDQQRFLFLERLNNAQALEYKVVYHEFLQEGLRKAMYLEFVNNDTGVVFEREGGLGFYNIALRYTVTTSFGGDIVDLDASGNDGLVFLITARDELQKYFVAVRLPHTLIIEAPFKSPDSFLARSGSRVVLGGGTALVLFELEKR